MSEHKGHSRHGAGDWDLFCRHMAGDGSGIPLFLPGSAADLGRLAGNLPVYLSGAFDLSQEVLAACRQWLSRQMGGVALVHARDLWGSLDDWEVRFPIEHTRFGAMVLLTAPEEETGRHVVGSVIATEIAVFCGSRRPIGWLTVLPGPRIWFRTCFAVEAISGGNLVHYATVAPAVDAEPFAPTCTYPVPRAGRPLIRAV